MSTPVHIVYEPYKDDKRRVAIVYKGTKQEVQVLVASGTNPAGETNWVAPTTAEEYNAVIEAWAQQSYREHCDRLDRENPRGGDGDR